MKGLASFQRMLKGRAVAVCAGSEKAPLNTWVCVPVLLVAKVLLMLSGVMLV